MINDNQQGYDTRGLAGIWSGALSSPWIRIGKERGISLRIAPCDDVSWSAIVQPGAILRGDFCQSGGKRLKKGDEGFRIWLPIGGKVEREGKKKPLRGARADLGAMRRWFRCNLCRAHSSTRHGCSCSWSGRSPVSSGPDA